MAGNSWRFHGLQLIRHGATGAMLFNWLYGSAFRMLRSLAAIFICRVRATHGIQEFRIQNIR